MSEDKDQPDLFDPHEHHRTTDPSTSRAAAYAAEGLATRHCALILEVIEQAGRPLAAEEVADRSKLDKVEVARRWSDLVRAGKVVMTDEKHQNRGGRFANRYALRKPS